MFGMDVHQLKLYAGVSVSMWDWDGEYWDAPSMFDFLGEALEYAVVQVAKTYGKALLEIVWAGAIVKLAEVEYDLIDENVVIKWAGSEVMVVEP